MEKQKKSGTLGSFLARFLSKSARLSLVRALHARVLGTALVRFPPDPAVIRGVLVLLPESDLEALHHITNVVSLRQFFPNAAFTLLCIPRVAEFFRIIPNITTIIEYEIADRFLFSKPFTVLGKTLREGQYDVCVLLESHPDIALLNLIAETGAVWRIACADAADYPFANCRIRPAERWTYRADKNVAISRVLGAPMAKPLRWTVSKESMEEVRHLFNEQNITTKGPLCCIDAIALYEQCGAPWLDMLIGRLRTVDAALFCVAARGADSGVLTWLSEHGVAIMPPLSVSRLAAVIQQSTFLVAGNSVMYQLGYLLQKPTTGIFSDEEYNAYCRESENCRGVGYRGIPDEKTIEAVFDTAVRAGLGQKKNPAKPE